MVNCVEYQFRGAMLRLSLTFLFVSDVKCENVQDLCLSCLSTGLSLCYPIEVNVNDSHLRTNEAYAQVEV